MYITIYITLYIFVDQPFPYVSPSVSVTKSSHQDRGLCCLDLLLLYIHSPLLLENIKLLLQLFSSAN